MLYGELKRIFFYFLHCLKALLHKYRFLVSERPLVDFSLFAALHIGCFFLYKFDQFSAKKYCKNVKGRAVFIYRNVCIYTWNSRCAYF